MATVLQDADRQSIRLAVVLNGGVSLAVWISGVALEMHELVQASRLPHSDREKNAYAALLDVLQADVRIDVISGTSAGGLNGGFLALGVTHGCDLAGMRDLWAEQGDLSLMLRDPRSTPAPSLLRGDYFADCLRAAYRGIARKRPGAGSPKDDPVELYLTGTLWDGRRSRFADDLGRQIVETDYDATFHFSTHPAETAAHGSPGDGDLRADGVADQLAVASRCTSSFPGAFEPYWVDVPGPRVGARWVSTAGLANFDRAQYVVDGGVLLNKPIRPALDAVYRQSAAQQVRRIMAYVVPDPGDQESDEDLPTRPDTDPHAAEVLVRVVGPMRSTDSVAAELAEIERTNQQVRARRRSRDRMATLLLNMPDAEGRNQLVEAAYPAYREVRNLSAARAVAALLTGSGTRRGWSDGEVVAVLQEIAEENDPPYVPQPGLEAALDATSAQWSWGQSEVERLGDLVVDVLKRAVWLAPLGSEARRDVVRARGSLHGVLAQIREDRAAVRRFWQDRGDDLPQRERGPVAEKATLDRLQAVLLRLLEGWERGETGRRRADQQARSLQLAHTLLEAGPALRTVLDSVPPRVDPDGSDRRRLAALVAVLVDGAGTDEQVLRRMLGLQVLQVATADVLPEVEQEVELVQVSSDSPDLVTGIQLHHFGAFYRESWRCNDWLRGRVDGVRQLVQMLLAPERLRQLYDPDGAYEALRKVAVGPSDDPMHAAFEREWEANAALLRAELAVLVGDKPLPRTFPLVAGAIARRIQAGFLQAELQALAAGVRAEPDPLAQSTAWASTVDTLPESPSLGQLDSVLLGSRAIGRQRIAQEVSAGTDTLARTVSHAAATAVGMATSLERPRLVATVLSSLRGYALLVWLLVGSLTRRSHVGRNVVSVVLGVGGTLLALTVVVPGLPVGLTLVGAGLLLGAASAVALVEGPTFGTMGRRLVLPFVLVLLALGAYIWWALAQSEDGALNALLGGLGRVGVVAVVVLLGWYVARARAPREATTDVRGGRADR